MSIVDSYLNEAKSLLDLVTAEESGVLEKAAETIVEAYEAGHHIYVFGCTHSAILTEEVFYRAGSLAIFEPLWGPGMSVVTTKAMMTSALERNEQLGKDIIECSRLKEGDVLIVISTSGKNAVPVEVAKSATERGVKVIGITSRKYDHLSGNHSSGKKLSTLDLHLLIDNHAPVGDSAVQVDKFPMAPLSTIIGAFIMHAIALNVAEKMVAQGKTPPVLLSSNVPGGAEHNAQFLSRDDIQQAYLLP